MAKIAIIGAGLAGLNAARLLTRGGNEVQVFEATDRIGGRVTTDSVEGFLCDRGFQLLNPAYPAARRALEYSSLDLHPYGRGVAVRSDSGLQVLADPSRHPLHAPDLLRGPIRAQDLSAAWRWLTSTSEKSGAGADAPIAQTLAQAGFSGELRRVIERFLTGVVLDEHLRTSTRHVRTLLGFFARGTPAIPAQGMVAIPTQLAHHVRGRVELGAHVDALTSTEGGYAVRLRGGETRQVDRVVLAAGPRSSAQLLGQPEPEMLGCTTWWFEARRSPSPLPFLHLDIRDGARLANAAVVSNISPSYAPAGRHLVQATAVGFHGLDDDAARSEAGRMFGVNPVEWRVLARHDIPNALPQVLPGTEALSSDLPGLAIPGVAVAGDTGDASIHGALTAGEAAARAVTG